MFVLKSLGRLILGNSEQIVLLKLEGGTFWQSIETREELKKEATIKFVVTRTKLLDQNAVLILQRSRGAGKVESEQKYSYEILVKQQIKDSNAEEKLNQKQTWIVPVDPSSLGFSRKDDKNANTSRFSWNGLEEGERFEFEMTTAEDSRNSVPFATLEMFHVTLAQCLFEADQKKPHTLASDADIQRYIDVEGQEALCATEDLLNEEAPLAFAEDEQIVFSSAPAGFYQFDGESSLFRPLSPEGSPVTAVITRPTGTGALRRQSYEHFLTILKCAGNEKDEVGSYLAKNILHRQPIDPDATLHTDRRSCSFVWCHYGQGLDGNSNSAGISRIWTFSLRFESAVPLMALSNAMGQAVYETLNEASFSKLALEDASYLLNPFTMSAEDVQMTDPEEAESDTTTDDESCGDDENEEDFEDDASPFRSDDGSNKNSQLAVGYKNDRSFVSRGTSIGVFKHTEDDRLAFHTKIDLSKKNAGGLDFTPSKMMLHNEDRSLILMNPDDPHHLHQMDLERGQVVETWAVHPDAPVTAILPSQKYAQMTGEATLLGLNKSSIFRIDPRINGPHKRVDEETKQYAVKNDFTCGATTGQGELAVASARGEIRLFDGDRVGKRAKTLLPGFGDPIIGIDVTESGRYILATCKTYLLLICTEINGARGSSGEVATGFQRSMGGADAKPRPIRLSLQPKHLSYISQSTGSAGGLSFTPARFSTGQSEERAIITSTGPFVITWNLRRVRQGHLFDYQIKRYTDNVVADNFRFGHDRSIVVTLPDHVTMISKSSLSAPSPRVLRGRRKDAVVDEYD